MHTLRPLDHLKDEPKSKNSFREVLCILEKNKVKEDWHVLPSLLEGYKNSKRVVTQGSKEMMLRLAGEAGALGAVKECFRRAGRTGLRLNDADFVSQVMLQATEIARYSGWSEEGLAEAIKFAEDILELMEEPKHKQQSQYINRDTDPRRKPEIVGVMMGLVAMRAVKFEGRYDEDGKVQRYTEIMQSLWENADLGFDESHWPSANRKLLVWAPVWHALKMQRRIHGQKSLSTRLFTEKALQDVEPMLERAKALVLANTLEEERGLRRGLSMYARLASTIE